MTDVYQETQDDPVGLGDGVGDRRGDLGGFRRDTHVLDGAGGDGNLRLTRYDVAASPVVHVCLDVNGRRRHGEDAALRAEETADPVEPLNRIIEELPQARDQQVAERMAVEWPARIQA